MTDTANAPERIWAFHAGPMVGLFIGKKEVGTNVAEYVLSTHCDELVAAAYLDAAQRIEQCLWSQHWYIDGESVDPEDLSEDIIKRTPDDARAALTAYGERMKADLAEAQAKIARLTEALNEKQDDGKNFWMNWTQKRLEINRAMFLRDAKLALAGDMRALRNRVELMEAEPVPIVLSSALQENANG